MLTDGEDNASKLSPEDAARLAQTLKVKVYTILAGNNDAEAQRAPGGHHTVNPKLLEEIASMTGGTPYLASDSRALRDRFQKILAELKRAPIHDRGLLYAELYRSFVLGGVRVARGGDRAAPHPFLEDSVTCASSARTRSGCCWPSRRR